jgi:hypothetical protein
MQTAHVVSRRKLGGETPRNCAQHHTHRFSTISRLAVRFWMASRVFADTSEPAGADGAVGWGAAAFLPNKEPKKPPLITNKGCLESRRQRKNHRCGLSACAAFLEGWRAPLCLHYVQLQPFLSGSPGSRWLAVRLQPLLLCVRMSGSQTPTLRHACLRDAPNCGRFVHVCVHTA